MGDGRTTVQRVGRLYRAVAAGHLADGFSFMTPEAGAVAIWAAPNRFKIPLHRMVPHAPGLLGAVGPAGVGRLLSTAEVEKLHPSEPHYYLAALGTRPEHQGKGLASSTMSPMLTRADTEGTGCFLESSKEDNLAFYARHGFEVTSTYDLAGGRGPRLWLMWREARPIRP
jgi:GNAT superfamily N-acetyltransferase